MRVTISAVYVYTKIPVIVVYYMVINGSNIFNPAVPIKLSKEDVHIL